MTIAVGVQERPAAAPQSDGPWESDYKLFGNPSFTEAITAVSSLIFAYCGTPAFFAIVSEMRDPRYYTRSLLFCQGSVTAIYIVIGTVIYYYCGSYVASPALGSAGVMVKKVAYGFSLPGLMVTTMLVIHVCPLPTLSLEYSIWLILYSSLQRSYSSASCAGPNTSPQTPPSTGSPGSDVHSA